jgi:hypothetical protein
LWVAFSNSPRTLQGRLLPFAVERFWFGPKKAQEQQLILFGLGENNGLYERVGRRRLTR